MTVLLGALAGAAPFAMDVYLTSMPSMARALAATPSELQLTLSVYMYGWGVGQLFAGPLSDRFGRRPALLGARLVQVRATRPNVIIANYARLLRTPPFAAYTGVAAFGFSGLLAFLAGSAFVFVSVMGESEQGFGLLFGSVMLGNITGSTIGSRIVRRLGIERMVRGGTLLMLVAGLALGALALLGTRHPLAVVVPMFVYMVAFMMTMPPATAGALTPFPQIAGSASSLLSFCQFVIASSAAFVVGSTFDGTARPMMLRIAVWRSARSLRAGSRCRAQRGARPAEFRRCAGARPAGERQLPVISRSIDETIGVAGSMPSRLTSDFAKSGRRSCKSRTFAVFCSRIIRP